MDISERIKEIRSHFCEGSNVKFAERMGENANTTSGWASGKRGIGNTVMQKILNKFPEISPTWLLTGEGNMLNSDAPTKESSDNKEYNNDSFSARELLNIIHDLTTQGKQNAEANERNSRNIESLIALLAKSLKQELDEKRESELDENKNSA